MHTYQSPVKMNWQEVPSKGAYHETTGEELFMRKVYRVDRDSPVEWIIKWLVTHLPDTGINTGR